MFASFLRLLSKLIVPNLTELEYDEDEGSESRRAR